MAPAGQQYRKCRRPPEGREAPAGFPPHRGCRCPSGAGGRCPGRGPGRVRPGSDPGHPGKSPDHRGGRGSHRLQPVHAGRLCDHRLRSPDQRCLGRSHTAAGPEGLLPLLRCGRSHRHPGIPGPGEGV